MINWRSLLDAIHVPWKDRGANCSRRHVNCKCPWCGSADPSYHLSISEENNAYYCYRAPLVHSGRSTPWLLLGLGVASSEIDRLISDFSDRRAPQALVAVPSQPVQWDRFEPAAEHPAAVDYLASRGYSDPEEVCRRHDLRFTRTGRHAWRVLFPLTYRGTVVGVAGRTIRGRDPRYLNDDPTSGGLFAPRSTSQRLVLLCEGPFDALAAAESGYPVRAAALLGTALPAERKMHLAELMRGAEHVVYVPDADQSISDTYRIIAELEKIPEFRPVRRGVLPAGRKDLGEIAAHREELFTWMQQQRGGLTPSGADRHSRPTRGPS